MSTLKQLLISSAQAEDQALLPEADEQIDQRQWTQQHLEAADVCGSTSLALTPPQADQEVDVLDVNVRGPGQYSWVSCMFCKPGTGLPYFQLLRLLTFKNNMGYTGIPAELLWYLIKARVHSRKESRRGWIMVYSTWDII